MIAAAVAPTASHLARGLPARRAAPASARAVPAPRRAAGPAAPAPRRVVVRAGETETAAGELMGMWLMWGGLDKRCAPPAVRAGGRLGDTPGAARGGVASLTLPRVAFFFVGLGVRRARGDERRTCPLPRAGPARRF